MKRPAPDKKASTISWKMRRLWPATQEGVSGNAKSQAAGASMAIRSAYALKDMPVDAPQKGIAHIMMTKNAEASNHSKEY